MFKQLSFIALVATGAACATAEQKPALPLPEPQQVTPAARLEADRALAGTLRAINARIRKGEGPQVRQELLEQARSRQTESQMKMLIAWTAGPTEDAWQEIAQLARSKPSEPWLPTALGLIYLNWKGFYDQADAELVRALAVRPGFLPALTGRADVLRLKGNLPEARAGYEAVLKQVPDWQEALVGLGLTLVALGDGAAARAPLEQAVKADPDDYVALEALARLAGAQNDPAAGELYARLLAFNPRDREAHLALAKLAQSKGDLAKAAESFAAALALSPDPAVARSVAEAWRKVGEGGEEAKALERLAQLEPQNADPLVRLAELRTAEHDYEAAEAALRGAADRRPDDAAIPLALARVLLEREELIGCIEQYRTAAAKGAAEAASEVKKVYARISLPEKPVSGNVNVVNNEVFGRLRRKFLELRKTNKNLGGRLTVRVPISEEGKALSVEIVEDTVHDPALAALVYFSLKDANFPKEKRAPRFEFFLNADGQ